MPIRGCTARHPSHERHRMKTRTSSRAARFEQIVRTLLGLLLLAAAAWAMLGGGASY